MGVKHSRITVTIGNVYLGILLLIFGVIVLHAPLSVGLGTVWPDYVLLIKSWKEILMLIAGFMALYLLYKHKKLAILKDPILLAVEAYAALHLILLLYLPQGAQESMAGLAIDLRYILYFVLVYVAMKLFPERRGLFIKIGVAGALAVLAFALLQVFVLPKDILKYIGYNTNTISSYLTIDKNNLFIRINSTLRGPNPLGAYAGIVIALITAALAKRKINRDSKSITILSVLLVGGLVALWASYSRTAWLGALIAVVTVLGAVFYRKLSTKLWITVGLAAIVIAGGIYLIRDTAFVSNVLLHNNPNGGSLVKSDEGHIGSLNSGLSQLINQPLGAGIGSTGSASLLGNNGEIIENQYLFTAHEVGWLGLGLFILIFVMIMQKLWQRRKDWLALGVFASGISLALIGILLPVWVDDTVSIVWWGLAAVAIMTNYKSSKI